MPKRRLFWELSFLLAVCAFATLSANKDLYRAIPAWHLTEPLSKYALVDWSGGYVFAKAKARLPEIRPMGHTSEALKEYASSLTEARAMARQKATELAKLRLMEAILNLPLDDAGSIRTHMLARRKLRAKMGMIESAFRTRSRRTGEGRVEIELAMPFLGRGGLYSFITDRYYNSEPIPSLDFTSGRDRISSLIVDLSEFSEFRPSLEPRIYTDNGRLIYGPELVSQTCAIRYGIVSYHKKESEARRDFRAGSRPYYVFAGGILGKNKSNVFLTSEDSEHILGILGGRKALRRCKVLFVVKKNPEK